MYTAEVKFKINEKVKDDSQTELVESIFGSWRMNGQILGDIYFAFIKNKNIFVHVLIPEKDSLLLKYANKYIGRYYLCGLCADAFNYYNLDIFNFWGF